jgi:putative Holliday junction resolvase
LAVGDSALGIAHPLGVIEVRSDSQRWDRLGQLVSEWKPGFWVVGLPVREDGAAHELAGAVRAFAGELESRFGLPVRLIDERFTSTEAAERLREAGVTGRSQKRHLDQLAATSILQSYFDRDHADP